MGARRIVLDTETTGLESSLGHRVIEIACVELSGRRPTGRHFHRYLNPDREIDIGAIQVHGLTNDFLADKPRFGDIAEEFIEFVEGAELLIHNAAFDVGFLDAQLLADVFLAMTRGQDALDISLVAAARERAPGTAPARPAHLAVVRASAEELAAHAAMCERIDEESKGRCLWKRAGTPA